MNSRTPGADRAAFTEIANQILEAYGTLAGPDDHVSMPRFRLERLLAEAAERGAKLAAPDLARLAGISLALGMVSAQLQIAAHAPVESADDGEILQISLDGTRRLLDDALSDLGDLHTRLSADPTPAP